MSVAGGYSITIPTYLDGFTEIKFPAVTDSEFTDGYYISLTLPESTTAALRPYKVYAYPSGSIDYWDGAVDYEPEPGYYVGGNVDMQWIGSSPTPLDSINLQFYWHTDEPEDGEYTFILKKLMITDDDYTPADPDEITPFAPTIVAEPAGMTELTDAEMLAMEKNWNVTTGDISEIGSTGTYKVTVKSAASSEIRIRFTYTAGTFEEAYLSFVFPETEGIRPTQIKVLAGTDDSFNNELDIWPWYVSPIDAAHYYGAQLDISTEFGGADTTPAKTVIIYLIMSDTDEDYEFTINKISVK
jgi:hypothetical protein